MTYTHSGFKSGDWPLIDMEGDGSSYKGKQIVDMTPKEVARMWCDEMMVIISAQLNAALLPDGLKISTDEV